jgi:hypothetical protein
MISLPWPASRRATGCSRWGARRGWRPGRWRGAASGSPASSSVPSWPRWPGRTWPSGRWRWYRANSRNGCCRVSHTGWCTRPRPGIGSTRRSATSERGRRCGPAVTWPSGRRDTCSPRAATRSSTRSRTSTTRSARGSRPARGARDPANFPRMTSRRAGSSRSSASATTTGGGFTRRRSTSSCSTRSPGTWPWRTGNGRGCTARSGGGSRCGGIIRCGGTGERRCR